MSNLVAKDFTNDQLALIRDTVAKGASPAEFDLFLYRCKHMGLDPLKPGEIFFIKYGNAPGTIVVGREGFRKRAASTGLHTGTKLGVVRDQNSKCIGAWCEVFRKGWEHPARIEVSLAEYNTGKAQWAKMPETMIQKIAEAAALRMAFPDELGGIYTKEEMDQAERDVSPPPAEKPRDKVTGTVKPADRKFDFGTAEKGYLGLTVAQAVERDGLPKVQQYIERLIESKTKENKGVPPKWTEMRDFVNSYAQSLKKPIEEPLFDPDQDDEFDAKVERMVDENMARNRYSMSEDNYDRE